MKEATISITFKPDSLSHHTDRFLATLWHVAQANPAPFGDAEAGQLAEQIGREIIKRWLSQVPPELWARQGEHHYWEALRQHCECVDGNWCLKASGGAA